MKNYLRIANKVMVVGLILGIFLLNGLAFPPAKKAEAAAYQMKNGYYVGNGSSRTVSGVGFQPQFVMIKSSTAAGVAVFKTSAMPASEMAFSSATANDTNSLITFNSDGFIAGNNANINTTDVIYYWVAFAGSDCTATGNFCVGTYTGNGSSPRTITTGFQPSLVIVKRNTAVEGHFRTASEPTNETLFFGNTARVTTGTHIASMVSNGFTVGATDNTSSAVYYYIAFGTTTGAFKEGTYTGSAADRRNITGVGFQPAWVFVKNATSATANNRYPVMNTTQMFGDNSSYINRATANFVDGIQALQSDGFQVGTNATVNESAGTLYWVAFGTVSQPTGSGSFQLQEGTYTGNGTSQSVTGLPFAPDLVIIKDASTNFAVWRSSTMNSDSTAYFSNAVANFTTGITALNSNGFTVGASTIVNTNANTYHWQAFGDAYEPQTNSGSSDFAVGAYYGNGIDTRTIDNLPFQPNLVVVKRNGATAGVWRSSTIVGDSAGHFGNTANAVNKIQAFSANGYEVGTDASTNTLANVYHWFAFKEGSNFKVGSYSGTGSTQNVTSVGFQPDVIWVKGATAVQGIAKPSTISGDGVSYFTNVANVTNRITGLLSNGFSIGGNQTESNTSGTTYYYLAWKGNPDPVVSITVTDGTIAYGTMAANTSKDTTASGLNDTQTITNDGNVTIDLNIQGQNTACPWTLAGSAGTDQYVHSFSTNAGGNWTALTTSYQSIYTGVAASGTRTFDLRLTTPSTSTCFTQQSANVTVQAVQQ